MTTLATVRDFGSKTLDLAWERRLTTLAIVGGVAVAATAAIVVMRMLRGRAEAPGEATADAADVPQTKGHDGKRFASGTANGTGRAATL